LKYRQSAWMRPSRFRKPVAYLQRPTCSRPFFSLPPFPVSRFGSSNNSIKDDNWRQNSSSHDEDEPEGNEEETQRYHERKIMPYVSIEYRPYISPVLTCWLLIDIVRKSCTIWSPTSIPIDISYHSVMRRRSSTPRVQIGSQIQEMDLWHSRQNSKSGFWD
jgi:hypothetical protein